MTKNTELFPNYRGFRRVYDAVKINLILRPCIIKISIFNRFNCYNIIIMAKNNEIEPKPNSINQIGAGTVITGEIISNGDMRIDGILNGNISTKGKLVVGETGSIKGEINCGNAVVEGKIEGKIIVSELLSLKATSRLIGDITISKLAIEPGCKFSGNCAMNFDIHAEKPRAIVEEQRKPI